MQSGFKIIKIVFAAIVILFMALVLLSYVFEDKIKLLTVQALNKSLKSEIKVGSISFSVIKNFPYASVEFTDLKCKGSNPEIFSSKELFNAKKVKLLFSLTNLLGSNYSIKKIIVADGNINFLTAKTGNVNYDIFKTDSSSGEVSFKIEKAVLENMHFYQQLKNKDFEQEIHISKLETSGNFAADVFSASLNTSAFIHFINSGEISFIKEKEISIKGVVSVNQKTNTVSFNDAEAKVAKLTLNGKGEIVNENGAVKLNLLFSTQDANAGELLSVLPKGILPDQLNGYSFKGNVNVQLGVTGVSDKKHSPEFNVRFGTAKTDIIPDNEKYSLRNASLQGYFTTKKSAAQPVSCLELKNFNASLEGRKVTANIEVTDFSAPYYSITADGEVGVASLLKYIAIDTLESASGLLKIKGSFRGQSGKPGSYVSSGYLEVRDLNFRIKHKPLNFTGFNGNFSFNGNDVRVSTLTGSAGKSNLQASGEIKNLYTWLLQKDQQLYIDADVDVEYMDLDELIQSDSHSDTLTRLDFAEDLVLDLNIRSRKAEFKKFSATDIAGSITLKNKVLSANAIRFNAVDGSIYLQGSINAGKPDSLMISYESNVRDLNIQKLFYQVGSFGQQVLTDKNLKGSVTSSVQFASVWSKTLNINSDKIYATADITIENGELLNFEPMLKLSRFVKGTDLRNVKFSTLKNSISISNRKINIPVMEINSTALNITASGTHTFDNIVDYKIKMRMSEILGKKVKDLNTEFGTIEDDGLGHWNLLLSMKGPLSNPKFTYDKKSIEEHITKSVKQGKDDFLKTIREEFRKPEQVKKKDPEKKQDELQLETEEE